MPSTAFVISCRCQVELACFDLFAEKGRQFAADTREVLQNFAGLAPVVRFRSAANHSCDTL